MSATLGVGSCGFSKLRGKERLPRDIRITRSIRTLPQMIDNGLGAVRSYAFNLLEIFCRKLLKLRQGWPALSDLLD